VSDRYAHNPATLLHIAEYLRDRGVDPLDIFRRADVSPAQLLGGWVLREHCFALGHYCGRPGCAAASTTGGGFHLPVSASDFGA
jgi:hypothetical protein